MLEYRRGSWSRELAIVKIVFDQTMTVPMGTRYYLQKISVKRDPSLTIDSKVVLHINVSQEYTFPVCLMTPIFLNDCVELDLKNYGVFIDELVMYRWEGVTTTTAYWSGVLERVS